MEKVSYTELVEKRENKGILVVDCYADWCGPCRGLMPILDNLSKEYTEDGVEFVKINVDTDGDISAKESVRGLPTVLIMKDGEVVEKIVGGKPENIYKEAIERVKNG